MERNGMNTLAAHGEDLFGSEGAKASIRAELRLDLKLNKDAWKALFRPRTRGLGITSRDNWLTAAQTF